MIGLDAHMVGTRETGNETYVVQLAAALGRLGGHKYRLYTPHPERLPATLVQAPHLSVRAFADVPSLVRIPWLYPRLARADGLALLHMTYIAPPRSPVPVVLAVHDVSYRIYPRFFSPRVRLVLGLLVGPSIRHAARVIVMSECTRHDVIRFYRVPAERVRVVPGAAGSQYRSQSEEEVGRVRHKYNLPERYFLAVGNIQPRKNLPKLVQAFGKVVGELDADTDGGGDGTASTAPVKLAIVGRSTWGGSEVERVVRQLGLEQRVVFTGYVPDEDLPALYTGALAFCYPSLYEGFGLPALEAMACGTPVVTSNVSSLPEVVGDAALLVNPTSVDEIARALDVLMRDIEVREEYRRRGLTRAAQFSWEHTARLTRDVYDQVLGVKRGD